MFVINFDFSSFSFFHKLIAINLPVVLTQLITYPLQRIQTQLIRSGNHHTNSQITEIPAILAQMVRKEGFPKCFNGLRYSLDYSVTQMTFKFFIFDHLMFTKWAETNKYAVYLSCVLANAFATLVSQSAFNYQTFASSLQPIKDNTTESVTQRLIKFTESRSVFRNGLKYTLPISVINSLVEVFMILKLQGKFLRASQQSPNQLAPVDFGYTKEELIIASMVLGVTSFTSHFAIQRQLQLCFDLKQRYNYWRGFSGTFLRNMGKGMLLYCVYFKYFEWMTDKIIEGQHQKREVHNILPKYYQSRGRTVYANDT